MSLRLRARTWFRSAAAVLGTAWLGCGGGGGGADLEGTMEAALFQIAAGETRTVTGDLTLTASDGITIAGTLLIPRHVNVNLITPGAFTVTGAIREAPARSASRQGAPETKVVFYAGNGMTIENVIETPSDLLIATGPGLNLGIVGHIEGRDGEDGTSSTDPGEDGASIKIGTPEAVTAARQFAANASAPLNLTVHPSASIKGGNGGDGFNDETGILNGKNLTVRGSNAGHGGDIEFGATTFTLYGSLKAGNGGEGGDGGAEGKAVAQDGIQPGERGGNVQATAGDGGDKGLLALYKDDVNGASSADARNGQNGKAGTINVKAGNGGPGAAGGNITASLGVDGTNTLEALFGSHGDATFSGGNGGVSEDQNGAGGNGGALNISTSDSRPPNHVKISAKGFGNGGSGFNGCSVLPTVPGTSGGVGGSISYGANGHFVEVDTSQSLNGSNGGNGSPTQGTGGTRGKFNGTPYGQDGAPGGPCSYVPETATGIGFLAVVLDADIIPGVLQAGDTIPLIRIDGGRPVPHHPLEGDHGCVTDHLHTQGGSIQVRHRLNNKWTTTPATPDPDANKCGFGRIVVVNSPLIQAKNQAVK